MRVRIHNLQLQSCHILRECTIVLLSDLHSDPKKIKASLKLLNEEIKPNIIVIDGDIYDSGKDKRNKETKECVTCFGKEYNTFLVKGNHDELVEDQDFFRDLGEKSRLIDNTNEGIEVSDYNIKVYGMNFPLEYYLKKEPRQQFNDKISQYNFDKDKLNILLCHTPNGFINPAGSLINLNPNGEEVLIFGAHNHDGLLPYELHKMVPHNIGIMDPRSYFFQRNVRGNYEDHNACLIISGGITKLYISDGGKFLSPLGMVLIPDIYVINIKPAQNIEGNSLSIVDVPHPKIKHM